MHCSQTISRWTAWAGGQGRNHALLVPKEAWTNLCGKLLPGPLGNGVHPGTTACFTCSNWESKFQDRYPYGKRMGPYQRKELRDSILHTHKRFGKCLWDMSKNALCLNTQYFNVCLIKVIPVNELVWKFNYRNCSVPKKEIHSAKPRCSITSFT